MWHVIYKELITTWTKTEKQTKKEVLYILVDHDCLYRLVYTTQEMSAPLEVSTLTWVIWTPLHHIIIYSWLDQQKQPYRQTTSTCI